MIESFKAMSAPFAATGPQNAAQVFELQKWLSERLPPEDACMLASWVATGKESARWWEFGQGTGGAAEWCEKQKHKPITLVDALDSLDLLKEPEISEAIRHWGNRKEFEFEQQTEKQSEEDTDKAIDEAIDTAKDVAKSAGFGLGLGVVIIAAIYFLGR
tara:strand:+ start:1378 stop:1854 length:477 start_codon:yes stop_codon:yes gene_type:complete